MPTTSAVIRIQPGTLTRECFGSLQDFANAIINAATVVTSVATSKLIIGAVAPSAEDRDGVWYRVVGSERSRFYQYTNGIWISEHPVDDIITDPGTRYLYVGSTAGVQGKDGGNGDPVTLTTGPFWEVDTAFNGRVPIGAGALPDSGTVIAVGERGGHDEVTLVMDQIPEHRHRIPVSSGSQGTIPRDEEIGFLDVSGDTWWNAGSSSPEGETFGETRAQGKSPSEIVPVSVVPAYVGVYVIKRTIRRYYTAV